jgi:hypothetical protein
MDVGRMGSVVCRLEDAEADWENNTAFIKLKGFYNDFDRPGTELGE